MTEKLYYEDSHLSRFHAQVLECEWDEKKKCFGVVLDRTAFFPEGGGQYADPGTLNGIAVEDVKEKGDRIFHYVKQALEPGTDAEGILDFRERFSRMQQHSGEHIVSGLVHRHFGYDNVGFHLGEDLVTMDFNGPLTEEQLRLVEYEANEAVAANVEILTAYPSKEELAELDYRSKKEIDGQVRIITVPGYDVCACCAPHVSRTGEIGMIKLVDAVKYKGGTRVSMLCGFRALRDYQAKEDSVRAISHLLSAKPAEVSEAVKRLQGENQQWKEKLARMQNHYLEKKLEEIQEGTEQYVLFEREMDKNAARRFADAGMRRCGKLCGIFLGDDENGYQYTFGSQTIELKAFLREFHESFPGKGGGKGEMVQGTVTGTEREIRKFLAEDSKILSGE